jgi:hypothetical protein
MASIGRRVLGKLKQIAEESSCALGNDDRAGLGDLPQARG